MNKELLRYFVSKAGFSGGEIAEKLGITRTSYYSKINAKRAFTQKEIALITVLCKLTPEDVWDIFFTGYVDKK